MSSQKTVVIESLFRQRWDPARNALRDAVVTLQDVSTAIQHANQTLPPGQRLLSTRNPANFFKDFVRNLRQARANWPESVRDLGFTARQSTGDGQCFEFRRLQPGEELFPEFCPVGDGTPVYEHESVSIPFASRSLGRNEETWLIQVLVRLRVLETHLALRSPQNFVEIDHLQMSVKLNRTEIDALFRGVTVDPSTGSGNIIIPVEAKGGDDILEDQLIQQARAVFSLPEISQTAAIPMAVKVVGPSRIHVIECELVTREEASTIASISIASDAVYQLKPLVPGIVG